MDKNAQPHHPRIFPRSQTNSSDLHQPIKNPAQTVPLNPPESASSPETTDSTSSGPFDAPQSHPSVPPETPESSADLDALAEVSKKWFEQIKSGALSGVNIERSIAYATDLGRGLQMLRTFPQGVAIFGSARLPEDNKYYIAARELGAKLAQNGHAVITGGGPSIMEAANRGAYEYGGRSIGLNIQLEFEQFPNPYLTNTMTFRYFFARKVMLAMSAKVYVFFPGGFGTLDEFSEILELVHTQKMPRMPLYLYGTEFWQPLEQFFKDRFITHGLISPEALELYHLTDDIHDIVEMANRIGHAKIADNLYDNYKH